MPKGCCNSAVFPGEQELLLISDITTQDREVILYMSVFPLGWLPSSLSLSQPKQPTIHTRHHEACTHLFLSPLALSLFEAPESSKVFTTGTKASCILTSAGKQNRVARQGSFKRQLRPFCSLLFMYKLQIAFANIFFKIKSSFLSFLQAPGARIKLMALMETRGGRGGQHLTPFAEAAATPC